MTPALACGIALAVALASAGFAAEGLTVGKSFNVTPELAQADQRWPAVACGNNIYLGVTGWEPGAPFAIRVGLDGKVSPWNMPAFRSQTYALASDAASGKSLVWGNSRIEHGSYAVVYSTSLQNAKGDAGLRQIVLGLQSRYPPRNDLWCAVVHDGKNFVSAVEQSPSLNSAERQGGSSVTVELVLTRFDTETGAALDVGSYRIPDSMKGDLRAAIHSKECEEAAKAAKPGIRMSDGPDVQMRHPALASAGGGRSLLVYSRHAGVNDFRIRAALLSE